VVVAGLVAATRWNIPGRADVMLTRLVGVAKGIYGGRFDMDARGFEAEPCKAHVSCGGSPCERNTMLSDQEFRSACNAFGAAHENAAAA